MKIQNIRESFFGGLLLGFGALSAVAGTPPAIPNPLPIPLKPDPPPSIDGSLDEWARVPNAQLIDQPAQAVYGRGAWRSPSDLSAKVWVAWREEAFYLAADVIDDRVVQTQRGENLFKGDHLELYLDVTPDADPKRDAFGAGQFHLGLSPGNFQHSGDPLRDILPEAYIYKPSGLAPCGVLVMAKRTDKGYALEAAIPWSLLGVKPAVGMPLSLEIGVSDTDSAEAAQEKMMTLLTTPWFQQTRARLVKAVLSAADGKPVAIVCSSGGETVSREVPVFDALNVKFRETQKVSFEVTDRPRGADAILKLNARLESDHVGGYLVAAMQLILNGQALDQTRLKNKRVTEERVDGQIQNMAVGEAFTVVYAPDDQTPDDDPSYALKHGKVCAFEWQVSDLLKTGTNTLAMVHTGSSGVTNRLSTAMGRLVFQTAAVAPPVSKRGPPTGPLPVFAPSPTHEVKYQLTSLKDSDLLLVIGKNAYRLESRFSTPEGVWVKESNRHFRMERQIQRSAESILVHDTFTNLTKSNLPLMQRHRVIPLGEDRLPAEDAWKEVRLGGLPLMTRVDARDTPNHPTAFGTRDGSGIGLMAFDDVFQVHVTSFSDGQSIGVADNCLALKPGARQVTEWVIFPVATPDYYAFVNAARRFRGTNYPIDGAFAFLRADPRNIGQWSDERVLAFIRNKSARFLCLPNTYPASATVQFPQGTDFQHLDFAEWRRELARRRRIASDVKNLSYFHCYLDTSADVSTRYADSRLLTSNGVQGDYGDPAYKIFIPLENNSYGKEIAKSVDLILDTIGCDGVFWDEFVGCRYLYHYGDPWDGVSADIDSNTMRISRLKSSVTLLTLPWRMKLARRILARGVLIANGPPHTRTEAELAYPRLGETGSINNCVEMQLSTPIALGDHLTERTEEDCYRIMHQALDYGCVYYWYHELQTAEPTHPHLTRYMYPITPVELREGCLIGKERIVTNRSGLYGWNDDSGHEAHVFDDHGREQEHFKAPTTIRDGKTFTELRMAEGWSAALIRKPQPSVGAAASGDQEGAGRPGSLTPYPLRDWQPPPQECRRRPERLPKPKTKKPKSN